MDYNDIIIITLLLITIMFLGIVIVKNNYFSTLQTELTKIQNKTNNNPQLSINDRLVNIQNKKNKHKYKHKYTHNQHAYNNNMNYDEMSEHEHIDIPNNKYSKQKNKNINNKKSFNNTQQYRQFTPNKVIIDDNCETENIKSLNSMDNTLSDLISVVENNI